MTPNPVTVRQTGTLQPERDALEVSIIPSGTEKADKRQLFTALNAKAGEH